MKIRPLLFFLQFVLAVPSIAQDNPLFIDNDFPMALKRASEERKVIFIDAYTDWCSWCKVMDKKTFTDQSVQKLLQQMIPLKMDMEKGTGVKLAMKYHISGFPSFIFMNPDGMLLGVEIGYMEPAEFNPVLEKYLNPKSIPIPGFSPSLEIPFPSFYQGYFGERAKRVRPETDTVAAYLDQQSDMFNEVNWGVLRMFSAGPKWTNFFLNNFPKYAALYGRADAESKLNKILDDMIVEAANDTNPAGMENVNSLINKYGGSDSRERKLYAMSYYQQKTGDFAGLSSTALEYQKIKGNQDPGTLNRWSWTIFESSKDPKAIGNGIKVMESVCKEHPEFAYLDTYANLLFQSGDKTRAKTAAEKAIAAGKASGEDTKETEELLLRINESLKK